jgi:hypothetical protein
MTDPTVAAALVHLDAHSPIRPFRATPRVSMAPPLVDVPGELEQSEPITILGAIHILDEKFWTARPLLEHIRQAAHSRNRSAEALLHVVLARLSACTPHEIQLPPIVGAPASLNYATAPVGPSGAGKSTVVAIARELVPATIAPVGFVDAVTLGSGEGLAETFIGEVDEEGDDGKKRRVRRQVRHNAFIYADEGEVLTTMLERKGATIASALRKAWVGEALGQQNGTAERTRNVPAHQYRMGIVLAFQPEKITALLDDAAGGTPQRFTYCSAIDPTIPDVAPTWPGPLNITWPKASEPHRHTVDGYRRTWLTVPAWLATEIRSDDRAQARGELQVEQLDSHARLHRLKIAGLLAIADGRLDIHDDDWQLASTIWAASCAVRAQLVETIAYTQRLEQTRRTRTLAERETVLEAARRGAGDTVTRLATRVARWAHDPDNGQPDNGWPVRDLRHRLAGREKVLWPEVLDQIIALGFLKETDEGRYTRGLARPAASS